MNEEKTQIADGVASELNAELDSLLEMATDYLSAQKENRLAPCNPDFLIKHLASVAKQEMSVIKAVVPLVSQDEKDNVTFEWWCENRKITMYPAENVLLRVWGLCIETEMQELQMNDPQKVKDAFLWLFGEI